MKENRFQRKKSQTREKIYAAAFELFMEKGYDQTTIQEIVEKADVAKGTFFVHFPTKDALLSYLGEERVMAMEDMLINTVPIQSSAKEKLSCMLKLLGEMNEENRVITELLSKEIFRRLLTNRIEREKGNQLKLKEMFIKIFEEGQQKGEFRQNINHEQASDTLVAIYFFALFQWLEKPEIPLTKVLLERLEILMQGIELS